VAAAVARVPLEGESFLAADGRLYLGQALAVALVLLVLLVGDVPLQERPLIHDINNSEASRRLTSRSRAGLFLTHIFDLEVPEHLLFLELVGQRLGLVYSSLDDRQGVVLMDDQLVLAVFAIALILGQQGIHPVVVPVECLTGFSGPVLYAGPPGHQLIQEDVCRRVRFTTRS
jgi:hypothetical protein